MTPVTTKGPNGSYTAWFGVRVTGALDLAITAGYADQPPDTRAQSAHQHNVGYLIRQLRTEPGLAVEARWLARDARLSLYLLGRVVSGSEAAARDAADRASAHLAALPEHVTGELVTDADELRAALTPFTPHVDGLAEVRRACVTARPQRPDAAVRYYVAVAPLRPAPERMPGLLHQIATHRAPVMFTVGLEPVVVPQEFGQALTQIARSYERLARPGEIVGTGIYRSARQPVSPDPFAVLAAPLFAEAAARYRGQAFQLRVALASPEAFDEGLATAVGEAIGSTAFAGASSFTIHRPRDTAERAAFARALSVLDVRRWDAAESPLPPALRPLAEIADPVEAAAVFHLPVAATGALPGFATLPPPPERQAVRTQVVYESGATHHEYQREVTIHGDLVGRDQHHHHHHGGNSGTTG